MKNHIIFTIVGSIVLFMWQFMSWAAINFHKEQQQYTPIEAEVLQAIADTGLEPGMYALGQGDSTGGEEAKWNDWAKNFQGKPWGVLNYQASNDNVMSENMMRSYLVNVVAAFLLFFMLSKTSVSGLKDTSILLIGMGIVGFIVEPYTYSIWYKIPGMTGHLIDAIVPWFIMAFLWTKLGTNKK